MKKIVKKATAEQEIKNKALECITREGIMEPETLMKYFRIYCHLLASPIPKLADTDLKND